MSVLSAFVDHARTAPDRTALLFTDPRDASVSETATYGELYARVHAFARGLPAAGIGVGDAVILACPLSVDFYALSIALVASRRQLVLIDGRLERRRLFSALRSARARAIVSVPEVLRRWPLVPPLWRVRRYAAGSLDGLAASGSDVDLLSGRASDPAIISFTSGSTGRAKGVIRTLGILDAQHAALSAHMPLDVSDVDMTCFPAVVLHNLACGVTTMLPPVDLRTPALVDPARCLDLMRSSGVTTLSCAPAFMDRLAGYGAASGWLPRLRRIVVGGAPVSPAMASSWLSAAPDASILVAYGSTEAEPIAHVDARSVAADAGEGVLVGEPVDEVSVVLAALPDRVDGPVAVDWLSSHYASPGEVVVSGAGVSREYVGDPEAVARNKIRVRDGSVWHRTGDVARLDELGRLRLLGRVGDAVAIGDGLVYPLALEGALNALAGVERVALVSARGGPTLAVAGDASSVRPALAAAGLADAVAVRTVDAIPVDLRHQSKVDRAALIAALDG
jgi:acyl-CoA synthetase (AMP-forming)/AMP-acid ligase II